MAVSGHFSLKKRLRLRELARFYCVTAPLLERDQNSEQTPSGLLPIPRLSHEPNLTALAQLAALRCNCQRSFISIIDDETQFIVAEATSSLSLFNADNHASGDQLLFGVQSLPLRQGVCPSTLKAFTGEDTLNLSSPNSVASDSFVLIPDLLSEPITKDVPALANMPPVLRYYLEVPLKTLSGYVLGSICVIDPVVRTPGPTELSSLQEIATLVVQNFEQIALKCDHSRAERLIQGLGHFVQGKSSLSLWSQSAPNQEKIPSAFAELGGISSTNLSRHAYSQIDTDMNDAISSSTSPTEVSMESTDRLASESTSDTCFTPGLENIESFLQPPTPGNVVSTSDGIPKSAAPPFLSMRKVFSRASNLIRESLDLDATSFLEVPHSERHKSLNSRKPKQDQRPNMEDLSHDEAELSASSSSESPFEAENLLASGGTTPRVTANTEPFCHRLGFSTAAKSSLANSTTATKFLTIPTHLLSRLAARYPNGKIFHFDSAGTISSGDDDTNKTTRKVHRLHHRPRKESEDLFKLFPEARSLAFFPLYDNDRQHIYAGFLGWTTKPTRVLQKHELIYISGFANSVMCEVMRLDALSTDKAKSDFISSMSHELRSPLHGILASGHLLSESNPSRQQVEFISMVNICARTLLDTMNHLLDHAKINNFTKNRRPISTSLTNGDIATSERDSFSLVSDVDILDLVEDTITSMGISSQWPQNKRDTDSNVLLTPDYETGVVPVILKVQPHYSWTCRTEPGSWRRIIMNLVGNAIKYTQRGHISIELTVESRSKTKALPEAGYVAEMKISDTGQGISDAYLKHRLFTPFAQENNLSVGAGLGLSLVSNIVSSLNGTIEVKSEVDIGSEFTVRIPLAASDAPAQKQIPENPIPVDSRSVAIIGFDEPPSISTAPDGVLDVRAKGLLVLKDSLTSTLTKWFDVQLDMVNPDVIVMEVSAFEARRAEFDQPGNRILIVSLDGKFSAATQAYQAQSVLLLPPFGPKQIANAMTSLFGTPNQNLNVQYTDIIQPEENHTSNVNTQIEVASIGPPLNLPNGLTSPSGISSMNRATADNSVAKSLTTQSRPSSRASNADTKRRSRTAFLLVDDNDINLRLLVTCAKQVKDIVLLTATNGKEALDKYQEAVDSGVDVITIFMDVSMPIMDGFESTRQIRLHEQKLGLDKTSRRSKIVALTGLGSANAETEIFGGGFDLYFRKPVSPKTLREMMHQDRTDAAER